MVHHVNTLLDPIDVTLVFQDLYFFSSSQVIYQNNVCILQYLLFKNQIRVLHHHEITIKFLYFLYLGLFNCCLLNFTTSLLIINTTACLSWYVLQF
jgi:hypothetical protein